MIIQAGGWLRWLYCLTLFAAIFPGVFGASGWVRLATGGGLLGYGAAVALTVIAVFGIRIFNVVRNRQTLVAFVTSKSQRALRLLGILFMAIGLLGSLAIFFVRPLTLGIFGKPGENGIAFFAMGVWVYSIASAGFPGILLFEASRLLGFEAKVSEKLQRRARS